MLEPVAAICGEFETEGSLVAVEPFGAGHIHDSYVSVYAAGTRSHRYFHQRINTTVFPDPPALMTNVDRVTQYIRSHLAAKGAEDLDRRTLRVVRTRRGELCHRTAQGDFWRTYHFVERARSVQTPVDRQLAYQAAYAFGCFQRLLEGFPPHRLAVLSPDFHNTALRYRAFEVAVQQDPLRRAATLADEIAFARNHASLAAALDEDSGIRPPRRVTHNDAKINNVLFEEDGQKALCVVDLDTVMPGLSLHDFGDMVRTMTCPAAEDEPDLSQVGVRAEWFRAVVAGYRDGTGKLLGEWERSLLVTAGKVLCYEQGLRFLTDHLLGDAYYKVHRLDQNRDRCRTQFRLLATLCAQEDDLEEIAESP